MEKLDTWDLQEWIWSIRGDLKHIKTTNRAKHQRKLMTLERLLDKYNKLQKKQT
jgi:hypothetical protein